MTSDREFSIILEDLHTKFDTFGEGLASLDRRLTSTQSMVAQNAEGITRNGMLIKTNAQKIDANHELILKLDQRLGRVEGHLALTEA